MARRAYPVHFPTPDGKKMTIPAVNTAENVSDVLNVLAQGHPFAVAFAYKDRMWKCSLRSAADGQDVAKIAEQFGGGGHKHAAGFEAAEIPWAWERPSSQ